MHTSYLDNCWKLRLSVHFSWFRALGLQRSRNGEPPPHLTIGRFPKMVVPPVIIHVSFRFSILNKPFNPFWSFWGTFMCGNRHYGPHPIRHPQNVQVSPSVSAHHSEIWAISPHVPERMTYAVQTWTSCHPQFVKRRGKIWDAHKIHFAAKKPSKSHSKSHFNCGFLTPGTPKRNESPVVIAVAAKLNGSPALLSPNGPGEAQDTVADEPRVLSWYPRRWALALVNHVTKNWWKDPPCYEKRKSTN
jgi:hypothetical protein